MIRRLGPGDEAVLAVLAADEADFDLEERSGPRTPATGTDADAYLSDLLVSDCDLASARELLASAGT